MKFIHIADVHLGACPEKGKALSEKRQEEIYGSFSAVIDTCNDEETDLLLISGDLFHKPPLVRELKDVNYHFQKLNKTKVVLIAGNHDYVGARSNYIDFKWADNVYMLLSEDMDSVYLEDIDTEIYGFSYHTRDIYEERYKNAAPSVEERINILLAHGGDERNIPIDMKQLQKSGFDYIALGHIHKAAIISKKAAYPGSLEALDKNELGDHGYIKGEITKYRVGSLDTFESVVNIDFVKSGVRNYRKLEITVTPDMSNGELMDIIRDTALWDGSLDMYRVYLSGFRDVSMEIDHRRILAVENIVELNDQTLPDFDFDQLCSQNKSNIIGMYINQIRNETEDQETANKALYYGLTALLNHSKA